MNSKADHVRSASQTRFHTCHWPKCEKQVPPAMWGCRKHWYMIPKPLRNKIWRTYQVGQEENMNVSRSYVEAAREVQQWIETHGDRT